MICEMIKNGNKVGSKVSNHNRRPVLEAENVLEGKMSKKQKNRNKHTRDNIFFKQRDPSLF